ncbi:MAG: ATP-binding protein [Coriobacteriales bacterium]|jgi:predicted AAA+ superfamily ATPase|nr:ATP-binding protein [Coriobacteriales bacterium]
MTTEQSWKDERERPVLLPRLAEEAVKTALLDTRVVAIQGARQTGKSTLARKIAFERGAPYITFDDQIQREAAVNDVAAFVRQSASSLFVVDEVQRVPGLALAIKEVVDCDNRPGQFLLTGSRDLTQGDTIEDSLAGRIEIIDLCGLSMRERTRNHGVFFDALFADDPMNVLFGQSGHLDRQEYLELALEGGYPEAIARREKARRDRWFDSYARQLLSKDVGRENRLRRASILPRVVRYLASVSGKPAVVANMARDLQEPRTTLEGYINILESVFLIDRIPSWSANATSRAIKHPRLMFRDSGLLARQLNAPSTVINDLTSNIAGPIFETFIYGELQKMLLAQSDVFNICHYRDTLKREVDIVLENNDGRITLIEVKLSTTVGASDFKAMDALRKAHSEVANCMLVYAGKRVVAFGERLFAVPAQLLWS